MPTSSHRVLLAIPESEIPAVAEALLAREAALRLAAWPIVPDGFKAECLLVWSPTVEQLACVAPRGFIQAYGAGVDRIIAHPGLPPGMPVARIVDPLMSAGMTQHILLAILRHFRHAEAFRQKQQAAAWTRLPHPDPRECPIGIMGIGAMGGHLSAAALHLGFPVRGWSRRRREMSGVQCYGGDGELADFLRDTRILVCLLPGTPHTANLLDARTFGLLPKGAYVINCARGTVLKEADLLAAIDSGHLAGAALDVFETEPLPAGSPLWRHPAIVVTPHIATFPVASGVAAQVVDNLRRLSRGEPLANLVDPRSGY